MLKLVLFRLILFSIPFLIWFAWHRMAVAKGRVAPRWPWGWLIGSAFLLVAASIAATALLAPTNVGRTYVPAQAQPDGSVKPGYYK